MILSFFCAQKRNVAPTWYEAVWLYWNTTFPYREMTVVCHSIFLQIKSTLPKSWTGENITYGISLFLCFGNLFKTKEGVFIWHNEMVANWQQHFLQKIIFYSFEVCFGDSVYVLSFGWFPKSDARGISVILKIFGLFLSNSIVYCILAEWLNVWGND